MTTNAGQPTDKPSTRGGGEPSHVPTQGRYGWITHTELSSTDPTATREWCAKVLGWTFRPAVPMSDGGEYHLFAYSDHGGGGIRKVVTPEEPGSLPYVEVMNAQESYEQAIRAGAEGVQSPTRVMEGVTIAVVRAPGGVTIGFAGP